MTVQLYRFLLLLLVVCFPVRAEELSLLDEQEAGRGWQIPGTAFRLGGYASASFKNDKRQPWTLGTDDLSLFVYWEGQGRLKLFAELDLEDGIKLGRSDGITTRYSYLALERLYVDYLYAEKLNFRVGKYLTPIGRWNVIHADPLVWTTSRPLITNHSFPTNATGVMLYGTLPLSGKDVDYSLYASLNEDWRPDPKLDPFTEAYGIRLNLPMLNGGKLGISYANFEQRDTRGEYKNLIGLDYQWTENRYEISSELIYRFSDKGNKDDEKGLFIQGVIPLSKHWYGITRYEFFDPAGAAPAMNVGIIGLARKFTPALIFKLEYSHASNNRIQAPEGLFTSIAILF